MEEFFLFIGFVLVVIIFFVVLGIQGKIKKSNDLLSNQLQELRSELRNLTREERLAKIIHDTLKVSGADIRQEIKPEIVSQPPPIQEVAKPMVENVNLENKVEKSEQITENITTPEKTISVNQTVPPTIKKQPQSEKIREKSFWEKNPDLEKFIGENLMSKIGIVVLVLGLAFFVKFAIDNEWISEYGRVGIGILCGGALIGVAHRMRASYQAFSSILVGGGLATFYFTISLAFHEYHIFSQTVAFVIMLFITGLSVLLSLSYNRQELAVLAILGGFATPVMVSTGGGNYIVLFSYITILNVGMLVLAYFKKWSVVNLVSYFSTLLLFGGWLTQQIYKHDSNPLVLIPYSGALVFAMVFYVLFFLMNIVNNLKEDEKFTGREIMVLLSNTIAFYSLGMLILQLQKIDAIRLNPNVEHIDFKGLFTIMMAAFNFAFTVFLYKRKSIDRNLVFLLIGIVLSLVSLSGPVQLNGNYITLFWAIEIVLLWWLWTKSSIEIFKPASMLVLFAMLVSWKMDLDKIYNSDINHSLSILTNKGFVTGFVCTLALGLYLWFLSKETYLFLYKTIKINFLKLFSAFSFVAVSYFTFYFELKFQLQNHVQFASAEQIVIGAYNFLYFSLIFWLVIQKNIRVVLETIFAISCVLLLSYPIVYRIVVGDLVDAYLMGNPLGFSPFLFHYITLILYFTLFTITTLWFVKNVNIKNSYYPIMTWSLLILGVITLSTELDHIILITKYVPATNSILDLSVYMELQKDNILEFSHRVGYPILWGVLATILMISGMKINMKNLRIMSLSLIVLTLVKLFVFDFKNMAPGGKIATLIILGVLILLVSFLYQKLKKIVIDGEIGEKTE